MKLTTSPTISISCQGIDLGFVCLQQGRTVQQELSALKEVCILIFFLESEPELYEGPFLHAFINSRALEVLQIVF